LKNTQLKSGSEKQRLREKKILIKASSDPKENKLSFSKEV